MFTATRSSRYAPATYFGFDRRNAAAQPATSRKKLVSTFILTHATETKSYRFDVYEGDEVSIELSYNTRRPCLQTWTMAREEARKWWAGLMKEGYERF